MAISAAIVDDQETDRSAVHALLTAWAKARGETVMAKTFPSAEQFLFHYETCPQYDLLLLDIELSRMDGVTMAKRIRRGNSTVEIVFITGYTDYIAEGYEVGALHYLIKPVNREKFFSVLDRARERLAQNAKYLTLEWNSQLVRLRLAEIRFLDVTQNYVTVHAREDYTLKRPLKEFLPQLDGRFFPVGRSLIVNLFFIRRVTKQEIVLSDGTVLPLPRGAYEKLNRAIIERT